MSKICSSSDCGCIYDDDCNYCANCGSPLSEQQESPIEQSKTPDVIADEEIIINTQKINETINSGLDGKALIQEIPTPITRINVGTTHIESSTPVVAPVVTTPSFDSSTIPTIYYSKPNSNSVEITFRYNSTGSFIEGQTGVLQFLAYQNDTSIQIARIEGEFNLDFVDHKKHVKIVGESSNIGWILKTGINIPKGEKGQFLVDGHINVWFELNKPSVRYKIQKHEYEIKEANIVSHKTVNINIDQSKNSGLIHGNTTVYIPEDVNNPEKRQNEAYTRISWSDLLISKERTNLSCNSINFVDEEQNTYISINMLKENEEFLAGKSRKLKGKHFCFIHNENEKDDCISRRHLKFHIIDNEIDVIDDSTNGAHFYDKKNNVNPKSSIGNISLGEIKNICCTKCRCYPESLVELVVKSLEDRNAQDTIAGVGLKLAKKYIAEGWRSRSYYHFNMLPEKTIKVDEFLGIPFGECHEFSNKDNLLQYRKKHGEWISLNDGDTININGKNLKIKFIYE